jgi:hypothetical protein
MASVNTVVAIGQSALVAKFALRVPPPAVTSTIGPGTRKTVIEGGHTLDKYPLSYRPADSLAGHLRFALRYEPVELGVLSEAFKTEGAAGDREAWIRAEPKGAYARRAWFL